MLEQLGRQQREMADRLEKLAGAADRTPRASSESSPSSVVLCNSNGGATWR